MKDSLGFIKISLKRSFAYRAENWLSMIIAPFTFFILLLVWSSVFAYSDGNVKNYSLNSLITYFLIMSLTTRFIYDGTAKGLEKEVKYGTFLTHLLKPKSFVYTSILNKIANRSLAILIEILPLIFIFIFLFKKYFIFGNFFFYAISLLFAFILSFLIHLIIGTIAFWFIDIRTIIYIFGFIINLASGVFIPIDLFPAVLQKVFNYLPFKYLVFEPINVYLNKYSTTLTNGLTNTVYQIFLNQIIWIFILLVIAKIFWSISMKRFSGVGT